MSPSPNYLTMPSVRPGNPMLFSSVALVAAVGCIGLSCLGCRPGKEEKELIKASILREIGIDDTADEKSEPVAMAETVPDQVERTWLPETTLPFEHWEIQYIGNRPVGFVHRRIERASSQEPGTLRLSANSRTRFRSRDTEVTQQVDIVAFERENGELMRFEGTVEVGSKTRRFEGLVRDGKLTLRTNFFGRGEPISIPWKPTDRGPFAIEQSLMRSPMKEKEQRQLRYFDPILGKPIDVQLTAYDYFETPTFDGKEETLLEIQITSSSGEGVSSSQIWVDRNGRGHKGYLPALDLRSFRCDQESAMVVVDQSELSELPLRPINMLGAAIDSTSTAPIRYRVETIESGFKLLLPSRTHQVARSIKDRKLDVTVYPASDLGDPIEDLQPEPSPPEDALASSLVIDADHPQIHEFIEQVLLEQNLTSADPVNRRAYALAKGIRARVESIPFDRQVSNGRNTLAAGKGDCFDHAALLTAACRGNGIPARIAIGLRCDFRVQPLTMNLHAWTEFHDGSQWIPIDSSTPDPMLPADRIKWIDSLWATINPYDSILQVAEHLSTLQISVMRTAP